jgi:transketolase
MRNAFIKSLTKLASKNKKIVLVVGDLGFSVVEEFKKKFPDRFYNAGVAEQNMTSLAAGLASEGFKVFTYSIANFPTFRCAEQIRNDVDYHNLSVTIVVVGGGLAYGNLGYSHHAIQDYGLMRLFPNMTILSPGDPIEVEGLLNFAIKNNGPNYFRLGKSGEPKFHKNKLIIKDSKFLPIFKNARSKKLILTTGSTLELGLKLLNKKKYSNFSVYSCPVWGQKYKKEISNELKKWKEIVILEDHLIDCGFFSYISEINRSIKARSISLNPNIIGKVGSQKYLNSLGGLK